MNFLTPEQVAEILKVSQETVLQWLRKSKLPGVRIGNVWRIEEGRFNQLITTQLDAPKSDLDNLSEYEEDDFAAVEKSRSGKRGRKPSGKYDGLKMYLRQAKGDQVKMSFSEIEESMNEKLPKSAYQLRPWWANDFSHSQSRAWLHEGWETRGVNLKDRIITFIRRK